jgi:hypothetical protein
VLGSETEDVVWLLAAAPNTKLDAHIKAEMQARRGLFVLILVITSLFLATFMYVDFKALEYAEVRSSALSVPGRDGSDVSPQVGSVNERKRSVEVT